MRKALLPAHGKGTGDAHHRTRTAAEEAALGFLFLAVVRPGQRRKEPRSAPRAAGRAQQLRASLCSSPPAWHVLLAEPRATKGSWGQAQNPLVTGSELSPTSRQGKRCSLTCWPFRFEPWIVTVPRGGKAHEALGPRLNTRLHCTAGHGCWRGLGLLGWGRTWWGRGGTGRCLCCSWALRNTNTESAIKSIGFMVAAAL